MKLRSVVMVFITAALLFASFGAAGVAEAATTGAIPQFTVADEFPVGSVNPVTVLRAPLITQFALDTLVTINSQGKVAPSLATSFSQPNATTYLYSIRHGVKFWNGDPLTATDVAYSLNQQCAVTSAQVGDCSDFANAVATGTYAVKVTLSQANAAFQYAPSYLGVFEERFAKAHAATLGQQGTLIMGSGPFEINSIDETTGATLTANPRWWGGKVNIQHLSVKFFTNPTSEGLAFRAGDVDFDPSVVSPKGFAAASGAKILSTPNNCSANFFTMNTREPGWSDVHVRRAVAYALNRTALMEANGGANRALYTVPTPGQLETIASLSQVNSLLGSVNLHKFNLAKAKQQMAESNYPHGFSTTLLEYNWGTTLNVVQVIVAELSKIGIKAKIDVAPTIPAFDADQDGSLSTRGTDFSIWGCASPDPSAYVQEMLGSWNLKQGQWNVSEYAPPSMDKLLNQGIASTSKSTRYSAYSGVVKQLAQAVPVVPLYTSDETAAISPKYQFVNFNQYTSGGAYVLHIRASGGD